METTTLIRTVHARIPTTYGEFQLYHFRDPRNQKEHLALVKGDVRGAGNILTRVHSECFTGDVLGSHRCDCGVQLQQALEQIGKADKGILLYLRQEGRGIGLSEKLHAYNLQDRGHDTVEANLMLGHRADEREYSAAAAILNDLEIRSIRLLTNNPAKIEHLTALGIHITERVPVETTMTVENEAYLRTKAQRMGHLFSPSHPHNNGSAPSPPAQSQGPNERIQWLAEQANRFYHMTGQPYVTLTYAQTLDGTIASHDGHPLKISSPEAMRLTHTLRANHDAILVGIGTVLADDPQLTVRLVPGKHPQPIVLDTRLRFPAQAKLAHHPLSVWIATAHTPDIVADIGADNIELLHLPQDSQNRVDLNSLLHQLGQRGIRSVMVEGGANILTSFLSLGLANYAVVTVSPQYFSGSNIIAPHLGPPGTSHSHNHRAGPTARMHDVVTTQEGSDIILWGSLTRQPHPSSPADKHQP